MRTLAQLTIGIALAVATVANAGAQELVRIAEPNWASGRAIAGLIKVVIEDKLGGSAELVPGTNAVIFKAMDRGKGEIDVHPDVWLPNQSNFTSEYVDSRKTVALSKNSYDGIAGFCVSRAFSEEHGIKSVFDLATPEAAALTDRDGDGQGEIWVGAQGWASTKANSVKVRDYGITNFFEPIIAEEEVASAAIKDALNKGEGFAFYCYAPHFNWFIFDMVMLEEPEFDEPRTTTWSSRRRIPTGSRNRGSRPPTSPRRSTSGIRGRWRSGYQRSRSSSPNIALDTETVNGWTHEIVVLKRDSREVARAWVEANAGRVDGWLGL